MRLRRCCENLDWLCQFYMDFMRYWVDWFCTMKWDVRCCGVIQVMWRCCWLLLGDVEMLWVFLELLWGDYVENFEKWWFTDWLPMWQILPPILIRLIHCGLIVFLFQIDIVSILDYCLIQIFGCRWWWLWWWCLRWCYWRLKGIKRMGV